MQNRRMMSFAVMLSVGSCATQMTMGNAVAGPYIVEKGPTLAPFGHVAFCLHSKAACKPRAGRQVIELSPANSALLEQVNRSVNAEIAPRDETSLLQNWQIAPAAGNCNDYAVTKQHELIKKGMPTAAVRLAVTKTPDGEGHLVVVVKTTEGDEVLDNRTDNISRWDQTDLTWLKVESSANPKLWREL